MAAPKDTNYISNLDFIALVIFILSAVAACAGGAYSIIDGAGPAKPFPFSEGWDHGAVMIGGVIGIVLSAVVGFVAHLQKKYV